jgi:hypothetical protein
LAAAAAEAKEQAYLPTLDDTFSELQGLNSVFGTGTGRLAVITQANEKLAALAG